MSADLSGVVPVVVTPFDEAGQVDEASVATLVEFELACGVQGLAVLGLMGEAHRLGETERVRVAEVFLKAVARRVPVVVGTSHAGTDVVVALSRAAEAAGADAVMVAPPPGLHGEAALVAHYGAVAAAVRIPIVIQDEPVSTGVLLPVELLARLAREIEGCRYVKLEEPPTPPKITALRRCPGGERLGVFGGLNGLYFIEELARGARGIMTGFAFPDLLVAIFCRFQAGDRAGAAALFDRYASLIRYEGQPGIGLALRKEILRRRGAIRTARVRAPGPLLDDVTREELEDVLARSGLELRSVFRG